MVLFKDTEMGQGSFTSPQEVLEVQGTGGDVSCSREGRVQGQGLFRILIVLETTMILEDVKLSGSSCRSGLVDAWIDWFAWSCLIDPGDVSIGNYWNSFLWGVPRSSGVLGITGESSKDIREFLAWKRGRRGRWWGCNRYLATKWFQKFVTLLLTLVVTIRCNLNSTGKGLVSNQGCLGGDIFSKWEVVNSGGPQVCRGFTVYAGVNEVGVWIGQGCFPGCFSPGIGEAKFFYEVDWIPVLELTDDIVLTRGNVVEPEIVSSGPKLECVGSDVREVPEEELGRCTRRLLLRGRQGSRCFSNSKEVSETLEGERGFRPAMNTRVVDEIVDGGGGVISTDLSISVGVEVGTSSCHVLFFIGMKSKGSAGNSRGRYSKARREGIGPNNVLKEIALIMGKNLSSESKTKVSESVYPALMMLLRGAKALRKAFSEVVPYSTEGEVGRGEVEDGLGTDVEGWEVGMGGGVDDAREEGVEVRRRDAEGCDGGEYAGVEDDAGGPGEYVGSSL
ncbi:hypothetical protein EDB89DRAFT_1900763 [Lactarius sanguifluus]|nr:hypothetical protein EDB89DRAFT_1900763 [Lactarius sanguifluus]